MVESTRISCPSCGGAGGGPFGRAGGAWDDEEYVCPKCEGLGMIAVVPEPVSVRPGLMKATPAAADEKAAPSKRKATA